MDEDQKIKDLETKVRYAIDALEKLHHRGGYCAGDSIDGVCLKDDCWIYRILQILKA